MSRSPGADHLAAQIRQNHKVAARVDARRDADNTLERLQQWQRARLRATYADFRDQDRYRAACRFFLEELYGGKHGRERDRQLERVVPVMRRFLPDDLLHAVGDALRLQAVSLELDLALSEHLEDADEIDQDTYAEAYRAMGAWRRRKEQIRLIDRLGRLLDETVQKPMIVRLVTVMRAPAKAAGFGLLQEFLERGLKAFRHMGGADDFMDAIVERETAALEAIRAGSETPFAPWIDQPL